MRKTQNKTSNLYKCNIQLFLKSKDKRVIRKFLKTGEMMDLTENPVFLDGTKYEQAFGPRVSTFFDEGLRQVIKQMQKPT